MGEATRLARGWAKGEGVRGRLGGASETRGAGLLLMGVRQAEASMLGTGVCLL